MRGKDLKNGGLPRKSCERALPAAVRHRFQPRTHAAGKAHIPRQSGAPCLAG